MTQGADGFSVRPFAACDRDSVVTLLCAAALPIDVDLELQKAWTEVWVGEWEPGDVAAVALVWRTADELELVAIATRANARRRGAARQLLQAVLAAAADRGSRQVHLEVRRGNRAARELYEALGFEATRVRTGYYADGEDAVEMYRSLP